MRETKISTALITIFESAPKPISVPEILKLLEKSQLSPNKTTIYRQIEQLQKKSIISPILLREGTTHYELKKTHHHHFICERCGDISCLNISSADICHAIQSLAAPGVKIKGHDFNLYGECEKCAT
jgi:Fur family zinc uptake transcriptional regulator